MRAWIIIHLVMPMEGKLSVIFGFGSFIKEKLFMFHVVVSQIILYACSRE